MAAAAVTIGVANDVPSGVITHSEVFAAPLDAITLIPFAGATRSTTVPRVDFCATWVEEPAASSPTPSTPGCEAGNLGLGSLPSLPTAATTSAPESCSARSDSMSAVDGLTVADTFTTCAPFRRSQPNASRRPCSKVFALHALDLTIRADRSVASGTRPTTATSGRFATRMLATAVPCPMGSCGDTAPPAERCKSGGCRGARRSSSTPESAIPMTIPAAERLLR